MNLGLQKGIVKLVPHNKKWRRLFEDEKKILIKVFGDTIVAIEHIGSTAIPGITTKPILDINVGVKSLEVAKTMKEKFEEIGYEHRPFQPGKTKEDLKWQELYVKGPESARTHHVHVTVYDNNYWRNDLMFRDYLCSHPDVAREYNELKKELSKKYADNRESYTKSKEQFIQSVLKQAREDVK